MPGPVAGQVRIEAAREYRQAAELAVIGCRAHDGQDPSEAQLPVALAVPVDDRVGTGGAAAGPGCRITAVHGLVACPWQHIAATADAELLRGCRCRDPGAGPLAARLVAGQRRAGECGDERGRGCGAGVQGSLAVGSGPPLVEPAQQPGDRLGVAVVAERGVDMIQEAGAERRRTGGLPGDRVGSCPGEPLPRRGGQRRGDLPGRRRLPPASRGGPRPGRWRPGRGSAPPAAPRCRRRGRRRRPGPPRWGSAGTAGPGSRRSARPAPRPGR